MFATSALLKTYTQVIHKIILCIVMADLLYVIIGAISILIPEYSTLQCNIIGMLQTYARIASFIWSCCFAHGVYVVIAREDPHKIKNNFSLYAKLSFLAPIAFSLYSMATQYFTLASDLDDVKFCTHQISQNKVDVPLSLLYTGPSAVTFGYLTVCYLLTMKSLSKLPYSYTCRLLAYPCITILSWGPFAIRGVFLQLNYKVSPEFEVFCSSMSALQGFLDALAYGLTYGVIKGYKDFCRKRCGSRHSRKLQELSKSLLPLMILEDEADEIDDDEETMEVSRFSFNHTARHYKSMHETCSSTPNSTIVRRVSTHDSFGNRRGKAHSENFSCMFLSLSNA